MQQEKKFWPLVNEAGSASSVPPARMDELWSLGWRHFGPKFFRYSLMWQEEEWKRVVNLRVSLEDWKPSRSQRRTLKRNSDLMVEIHPANPGPQESELFQVHKRRFRDNVPDHLSDFLGEEPNGCPGPCLQVSVRDGEKLVAVSFLDLGEDSCSSVYGIFHPGKSERRLGIYTMLQEMLFAQEQGLRYYYLGYACVESSPYDYKKEVHPIEVWDWSKWQDAKLADYSKLVLPKEVTHLE